LNGIGYKILPLNSVLLEAVKILLAKLTLLLLFPMVLALAMGFVFDYNWPHATCLFNTNKLWLKQKLEMELVSLVYWQLPSSC
jgi:hypothetical protein